MSKLESAAAFNALVDEGKYESKTNAQRAAGRTRLSDSEKKKCFAHIEEYFGPDGSPPAGKKPGKKLAAKKKVARVASEPAAPSSKRAKKKAVVKKGPRGGKAAPGTLPISPSQVENAGDMLSLIDSTVLKGESIIQALKRANEVSEEGDIIEGVKYVKESFTKAAQLLHQTVVAPLQQTAAAHGDAETAARLAQAVQASTTESVHVGEQMFVPPPGTV